MAKTRKILPTKNAEQPARKRVCAYARVSTDKDEAQGSIANQIMGYTELITANPAYEFCGVFADEDCTGTKDSRANFQKMMALCRAGKIDLIITKSISRFARNTVLLLQTVRELKSLGVDVYFENEKINSLTAEGEILMTIMASYAQDQSRVASENQNFNVKRKFENGDAIGKTLGYDTIDNKLIINSTDAEIVRAIFMAYLDGESIAMIGKRLNLSRNQVRYALRNERYVGDLLCQKSYTTDHLSKKAKVNKGEKDQWLHENHHEPIISRADFAKVQDLLQDKAERYSHKGTCEHPLKGKVKCGLCGCDFVRKQAYHLSWRCVRVGSGKCKNGAIRESVLLEKVGNVDFSSIVIAHGTITTDGGQIIEWSNPSRKEIWRKKKNEKQTNSD